MKKPTYDIKADWPLTLLRNATSAAAAIRKNVNFSRPVKNPPKPLKPPGPSDSLRAYKKLLSSPKETPTETSGND